MSNRYTKEKFIAKAKMIHEKDDYDYSKVNYINCYTKVTIICNVVENGIKHGEFNQTPIMHLKNHGCHKCGKNKDMLYANNVILNHGKEFVEKAIKVHKNKKYDYSKVNYINSNTKVCIICNKIENGIKHGEFNQTPNRHLDGRGCPKCANNIKLTSEIFIEKARKIHKHKNYDYSKVNYINCHTKVIIICKNKYKNGKEHGDFSQTPNSHLNYKGCPKCNESYGEKLISNILIKNDINFINEKTYKNLKSINNNYLRFDFYLPDHNILIEFDGRQHFDKKYYNQHYGKYEQNNYDKLKKHDKMKTKYCKKNNIKLIRIPYYKGSKVEEILDFNLLFKKAA
jgi:hypothetical protein